LPRISARLTLSLSRTPMLRICSVGSMKVRPTYWLRMMPMPKGMPDSARSRWRRGCPSRGRGRRGRPPRAPRGRAPGRWPRAFRRRSGRDERVGAREVDVLEDAEAGLAGRKGKWLSTPLSSEITTISPGSTSRRKSAPTMSRAQVSEARTQPVPEAAEDEGADAQGVAAAHELGPRHGDDGEGALDLAERVLHPVHQRRPMERAMRWMMHSVSEEDWKIEPRSISSRRRAAALVRLPLWAMARRPGRTRRRRAGRCG
jgi:hypothetical protein